MSDNTDPKVESNLEALEKLRALPRGSSVDSRIAAIQNMLGEKEAFRTLQKLRWPRKVVCPRCHSANVVRRAPPKDAPDARQYYECLSCKGEGSISLFDDLTGLAGEGSAGGIRQWILCWYLIGFCSLSQVAKVLGVSPQQAAQLADLGTHIAEVTEEEVAELKSSFLSGNYRDKMKKQEKTKRAQVEEDQTRTASETLGQFKPGPKSRK